MKITRFEDVEAWKAARRLVNLAYESTSGRSFIRDFELRRQMITSAASAMANIAEGFDSGSDPEFARFLRISQRSATEFQSHLYVASDRGYLEPEDFTRLYAAASEVKKLVGGFIKHLEKTPARARLRTKD
ncbi:MAG TPA: four helix bundle protein [Thermoanaerobaculia bacterium]|nr:four helix bundle protein [Thermoanaerobaculia bacterium]